MTDWSTPILILGGVSGQTPANPWPLYERIKAIYRASTPNVSAAQFEAFCKALADTLVV